MTKKLFSALALTGALVLSGPGYISTAAAQAPVTVGGAPMFADKNIVENAVNSADHTTLVAAVQAADLVETLQSPGPFTVFAPTNAAFDKLPDGTVASLLEPDMKDALTTVLTYHVVPGRLTAQDLMNQIRSNGGAYTMTTAAGKPITARMNDNRIVIIDESNGGATVTIGDVLQSNGVIHVVDSVLLPRM
ncbi:MAG: fasciclin domain-containing protein [Salinarimonadaceae bacterium]|nr:MAG: fasciclin domain-containing protein [Salinarimonadaceae bacterium]